MMPLVGLVLAAPASASAASFDPSSEFALKDWVPIHLGGLDRLSINKAVVYLLVGSALTCVLGIVLMRFRLRHVPGRRQTFGEVIYDIAETQVAETGLPDKAMARWFPYVATLMLFIFVINLLGFLPLPFTGETYHHVPVWGIYAATSSISVTLALALMTWMFTHIEGIRYNGVWGYLKSWIPEVPKAILPLIIVIEVFSQFMRLIQPSRSGSTRQYVGRAHPDLDDDRADVHHPQLALAGVRPPGGLPLLRLRGVVIVVTIQAFIFARPLSAIYIGTAIEPEH